MGGRWSSVATSPTCSAGGGCSLPPPKCTQFRGHRTPCTHSSPACRDSSVGSVSVTRSGTGGDAGTDTAQEELAAQPES